MLTPLRSFLAVMEEGGVNRAARRLGTSQPTLSRHIQSLEQELGGALFEREVSGMRPTDLGFFVRDSFAPLVREYERVRAEAIAFAQGRHHQLRIGYIGLAATKYLNTSLARLKREFSDVRLMLFDQTPSEQLQALRDGMIDVALAGQEVARLGQDFYRRRVALLNVCAALPTEHPLSGEALIALARLKGERFVGVAEASVPGRTAWIIELCSRAGFRPKIIAQTESIIDTFALVAGEGAVALLPDYMVGAPPPGVAYVRLADKWATWSFYVLRQRGRGQPAARRLVELIGTEA